MNLNKHLKILTKAHLAVVYSTDRYIPRSDSSESRRDSLPRSGQATVGDRDVRFSSRSLARSLETERSPQEMERFKKGWVKYPTWPPENSIEKPRKEISKAKKRAVCYYFKQRIVCPYGAACRFSHTWNNRTKKHRARGSRGGAGRKNLKNQVSLGTQVAVQAVQSLMLSGNAESAKKLVLELNK